MRGVASNASGLGAVVRVKSDGGEQWQAVKSGSSYCSQSQLAVTFGLGQDTSADVTVEWPSGHIDNLGALKTNRWVVVQEGRGLLTD